MRYPYSLLQTKHFVCPFNGSKYKSGNFSCDIQYSETSGLSILFLTILSHPGFSSTQAFHGNRYWHYTGLQAGDLIAGDLRRAFPHQTLEIRNTKLHRIVFLTLFPGIPAIFTITGLFSSGCFQACGTFNVFREQILSD